MGVAANNLPVAISESNGTRSESIVKRMADVLLTTFIRHRAMTIGFWKASVICISLVSAFLLRFDFSIPAMEIRHLKVGLLIALLTKLSIFYLFGLDRGWWRFTGINDARRILAANLAGSLLFAMGCAIVFGTNFSRSVYLIDALLCFVISCGSRLSVRLYHESVLAKGASPKTSKGLLIYGAGTAGLNLVREIRATRGSKYRIVGFLDDDLSKQHATLLGVQVKGRGRDAARIVDKYRHEKNRIDEIVIALPTASGRQISEALANCRATGLPCKTIPSMSELLSGRVKLSQIREVNVENLLQREPVNLQVELIRQSIIGRAVMVTGAGGSIGFELCRQLLQFQPKCLVALDQAESELFKIEMELGDASKGVFRPVIGDIRNYDRIQSVVRQYGIGAIYHTAAYKHVPMMENNLLEAVATNVMGLYNLARIASDNGITSFVMISSDKAVNPTNIMGLTKRVAELIVSSMPTSRGGIHTRFVSVRFGNVLDSNGSVVPIFRAQIAAGGPVTITHPEMKRYFMTIPEAVQLVLQASVLGQGSETFVLDMGEPVKIVDLARNMISLSGHDPDSEIAIRIVGVRPGEKLYEELSTASDAMRPTCHEKIKVFCGSVLHKEFVEQWISELKTLVEQRDEIGALAHMTEIVPEYRPSERWRTALSVGKAKAAAVGT